MMRRQIPDLLSLRAFENACSQPADVPLHLRREVAYTYSFTDSGRAGEFLDWLLVHGQRVSLAGAECHVSVLPVMLPHAENIAAFRKVVGHKAMLRGGAPAGDPVVREIAPTGFVEVTLRVGDGWQALARTLLAQEGSVQAWPREQAGGLRCLSIRSSHPAGDAWIESLAREHDAFIETTSKFQ